MAADSSINSKTRKLIEVSETIDLKSTNIRFRLLTHICLSGFGCFYVLNSPSVLVTELENVIPT